MRKATTVVIRLAVLVALSTFLPVALGSIVSLCDLSRLSAPVVQPFGLISPLRYREPQRPHKEDPINFGRALFQQPARGGDFQGEWNWAIYPTSRDELPPAYRKEKLKDVPVASAGLIVKQRGRKLSGDYSATRNYLARVEDGEFDAIIKGNTATLELESGFGGTVTVLLTLKGNRLHWKVIKSEGESYFPDDVFLHRVASRKSRR